LCAGLSAQDFRATISGHVLDSSGAAVPNAKIQAISVATAETTNAVSDNSGAYTIPLLRPGLYKVTATAQGFKQYVKDNIQLDAAKVVGVDINLEIGAVTDTVEVTADAAMLETQTASRGGIVTTQQVAEMPLNARNPFMLGAMMSGVTFNGAAIWQRPFDNGAIAEWSVNGSRNSSTEFFLDGASNNGQMGSNNIAYVPIVDAVQEFQVMQNLYNSEYGHTGGGILNVVLKSGTNQFHGTVWEYMRRTALDANTFQNNANGANRGPDGKAIRPTHYLDQYGFQLEGPGRIPGLFKKDGWAKLFYLGSFENYREGTPNPLTVSWPEQEMRNGDFSRLRTGAGLLIPIYDPATAVYDANGNITTPRQVFPGNIIPANRIDPVAKAVSSYMPVPNRPAPASVRYANQNLFIPDYFAKDKFYNLILKFDMSFGDKDRAYFRHASNDRTEDRAGNGIDNQPGTDGQQPFQRINDAYVADWTRTFTPTLVANVRASFNRFIEKGFGRANEGFDLTKLGVPQSVISQLPYQDKIYFGRWESEGYASLGRGQSNNFTNTYELQGSVTKIWGSHTMKFGIDARQINYMQQNSGNILRYTGQTTWTRDAFVNGNPGTGDGYASFLIGGVSGATDYPLFPWWKQHYVAMYANDDWKLTRKLTLNLGLRYDLNQPVYEKWNRMNGPFDPNVTSPVKVDPAVIAQLQAANVPSYVISNLQNLKGGLTFAGVNGVSRTAAPLIKNNWGPRVGLAYQINDRIVLRTGAGLYYSNPNNDFFRTSGFSTNTAIVNSLNDGRTFIPGLFSNPFPNGVNVPSGSSLGPATFVGQNPTWFDPSEFVTPKVWSFSFGFQFQTTKDSTLEVTYVGSRSFDLQSGGNDFNLYPREFERQCNLYRGGNPNFCNQTVPNPFRGNPLFTGQTYFSATSISRADVARPPAVQRRSQPDRTEHRVDALQLAPAQLQPSAAQRDLGPRQLHAVQAGGEVQCHGQLYRRAAAGPLLPGSPARPQGNGDLRTAVRRGKEVGRRRQPDRPQGDLRLAVEQLLQPRAEGLPVGYPGQCDPAEGSADSGRNVQRHDRLESGSRSPLESMRAEAEQRRQHHRASVEHRSRLRRGLQQQLGQLRLARDGAELRSVPLHAVPLRPDPPPHGDATRRFAPEDHPDPREHAVPVRLRGVQPAQPQLLRPRPGYDEPRRRQRQLRFDPPGDRIDAEHPASPDPGPLQVQLVTA
jgi:hypothetical protein